MLCCILVKYIVQIISFNYSHRHAIKILEVLIINLVIVFAPY